MVLFLYLHQHKIIDRFFIIFHVNVFILEELILLLISLRTEFFLVLETLNVCIINS